MSAHCSAQCLIWCQHLYFGLWCCFYVYTFMQYENRNDSGLLICYSSKIHCVFSSSSFFHTLDIKQTNKLLGTFIWTKHLKLWHSIVLCVFAQQQKEEAGKKHTLTRCSKKKKGNSTLIHAVLTQCRNSMLYGLLTVHHYIYRFLVLSSSGCMQRAQLLS